MVSCTGSAHIRGKHDIVLAYLYDYEQGFKRTDLKQQEERTQSRDKLRTVKFRNASNQRTTIPGLQRRGWSSEWHCQSFQDPAWPFRVLSWDTQPEHCGPPPNLPPFWIIQRPSGKLDPRAIDEAAHYPGSSAINLFPRAAACRFNSFNPLHKKPNKSFERYDWIKVLERLLEVLFVAVRRPDDFPHSPPPSSFLNGVREELEGGVRWSWVGNIEKMADEMADDKLHLG